jgi:hypothetical protein
MVQDTLLYNLQAEFCRHRQVPENGTLIALAGLGVWAHIRDKEKALE